MAKKILIIEDDPTALRLTEYTLKQRGHQVLTTCNGLEGIITAQKEAPDLIILDIMLPGIDGFEVCRRLRAGVQTADIPILVISGKADQEDIATGFRVGASDYLPKPATPSDIISHAENLLTERPAGHAKIIAFISSDRNLGITMILANLAVVISETGKQVTLIDVADNQKRNTGQISLPSRSPDRVILETASTYDDIPERAAEVLPSGVRMLHIKEIPESGENPDTGNIELLHKLGEVADYLLVDLPLQPTPFARSTFPHYDLIIIAGDYRIHTLSEMQGTIKLLRFLGITPERIATVLIDPEAKFPSASLGSVKPYIEINLGTTLAGVISFDVKTYQFSYMESQSAVQSGPGSQFTQDIKRIAQYIITHSNTSQISHRSGAGVINLESE